MILEYINEITFETSWIGNIKRSLIWQDSFQKNDDNSLGCSHCISRNSILLSINLAPLYYLFLLISLSKSIWSVKQKNFFHLNE